MESTKEVTMFVPVKKVLTITDFKEIVEGLNDKIMPHATALFKHRKSLTELSYYLYSFYKQGTLVVYAQVEVPEIPAGFLCVTIGELWWIEGRVLIEELVLSLTPRDTGFGRFAVWQMQRMAIANGCKLVLSGSSMVEKTKQVTNLYRDNGFEVYGVSFLKELED